jgi:amidase
MEKNMSLQRPEPDDLIAAAANLNIPLTTTEADIFSRQMRNYLNALDGFLDLRIEEYAPPRRYLERDPGRRPTVEEDPLNLFIRKCEVKGAATGLLAGRTVALKDHIALAGVPLSLGSFFMDGYIPDFDATIVTRLLDAGAVIIGKANMDGFSIGGPGVSGVGDFGRPLNPHDPERVTGGSSSGAGAIVAMREADIVFGGDQGGSIRIPAAWSGAIGLKATHGLIPHSGVFGMEPSIDYVGPLTRTVETLAAVLTVVAGHDGYDPRQGSVPAVLPDYIGALGQDLAGLTIGVLAEGFGLPGAEPDVEEKVRAAIRVLGGLGASMRTVSVPYHRVGLQALLPIYFEGVRRAFDNNFAESFGGPFMPKSFMTHFGRAKRNHAAELPLNIRLFAIAGTLAHRQMDGRLLARAYAMRPAITQQYDHAFGQVDILAMPTMLTKAPRYAEPSDFADAIRKGFFGNDGALLTANTASFNLTGFPALSIPCGLSDGLPVGLQLVAPKFREELLIQAAHAYQRAVDWDSHFP